MIEKTLLASVSGLEVSKLCLGTMNLGEPGRGHQGDWTLDLNDSRQIIKQAIELGINYFDSANVYGLGATETVVGKLLKELLPRNEYVLTTKVSMPMGRKPNQGGLSRKHIFESVDASLKRLGHDYVDQLIIHRHPHTNIMHSNTPIEETMEALHDIVKQGKALYLGASSMFAWQFAELQAVAKYHNFTAFISMQNHYNLIYREEEREMNPYCVQHGIGITPWSPLARGLLSGSYKGTYESGSTARSTGQDIQRTKSLYPNPNFQIIDRVHQIADKYAVAPAQIALAWLLNKPGISAPVIGVSKVSQLKESAAATLISLAPEDLVFLEELYTPTDNLLSLGAS